MAGKRPNTTRRGSNDWLVGPRFKGNGLALLRGPGSGTASPSGHASDYYDGIDAPQLRVYNRAFYLLANTSGWQTRKAFEVFVLANRLYWGPNTTFDQGGGDQAATDPATA